MTHPDETMRALQILTERNVTGIDDKSITVVRVVPPAEEAEQQRMRYGRVIGLIWITFTRWGVDHTSSIEVNQAVWDGTE